MSITHHPADATLMEYAAGTLSEPLAIVVASHIELCVECQNTHRVMTAAGGALMNSAAAASLDDRALEGLMQRLDEPETVSPAQAKLRAPLPAGAAGLPGPLARLVGGGVDSILWRNVLPGADDRQYSFPTKLGVHSLRFLRASPGRELPEHSHAGTELTLVLRGALRDGDRIYLAGDVTDMDDEGTHNPIVHGNETCVCVIANEGPPRFSDLKMRVLQKLIGL